MSLQMELVIVFMTCSLYGQVVSEGTTTPISVAGFSGNEPKQDEPYGDLTPQNSLSCQICSDVFDDPKSFILHMQNSHPDRKLDLCDVRASTSSCTTEMETNTKNWRDRKSVLCEHCGTKFTINNHLRRHLMVHTDEKPFPCVRCDQRFREECKLMARSRIHLDKKTKGPSHEKSCEVFGKKSSTKWLALGHGEIHENEKDLSCELCGRCFKNESNLKHHMKTHSSEKPFVCELCNRGFKHKCSLKHHTKTHLRKKPFACKLCDMSYGCISSLKKHMNFHVTKGASVSEFPGTSSDGASELPRNADINGGNGCSLDTRCDTGYGMTSAEQHQNTYVTLQFGQEDPTAGTASCEQEVVMMEDNNPLVEQFDGVDHESRLSISAGSDISSTSSQVTRVTLESTDSSSCEASNVILEEVQRVISEIVRLYHETRGTRVFYTSQNESVLKHFD